MVGVMIQSVLPGAADAGIEAGVGGLILVGSPESSHGHPLIQHWIRADFEKSDAKRLGQRGGQNGRQPVPSKASHQTTAAARTNGDSSHAQCPVGFPNTQIDRLRQRRRDPRQKDHR